MIRDIPPQASRFIQDEEACVLRVYDDKQPNKKLKAGDAPRGTLTAGWGHTGGLIAGQAVTLAQAQAWLDDDLQVAADRLDDVVHPDALEALNDNQYAALLSFVFNTGANPGWTIWKRINTGHLDAVPAELLRFVYSDGEKMGGLVKRRTNEVALWNRPVGRELAKVDQPPSSVTRAADSTPAPAPPKPLAAPSLTAKIAGGVAAVGAGATQVHAIVAPHVNVDPIFAKVAAGLIGVTIVCAAIGLFISHQQHKASQC